MRHLTATVSVLVLVVAGLGQQLIHRTTNQDVIDMVSLGLSDDVIIDKIGAIDASDFDTSVAGLKTLKLGKVSDAVIRVMINPHGNTKLGSPAAVSPRSSNTGMPDEAGVYAVLNGKPAEIEPEVVNWQTGGVAKSHATLFLLKEDVNGKVMNPTSPTRLTTPIESLSKPLREHLQRNISFCVCTRRAIDVNSARCHRGDRGTPGDAAFRL
ncbi:MAG: hypothetical protein WB660_03250 [Candidatus Sulfotelmatobacter sp.]